MASEKKSMAAAYDAIVTPYLEFAESQPLQRLEYLNKMLSHLPPSSTVLELGCGSGVPATVALAAHPNVANIIANDISPGQLRLAKTRFDTKTLERIDFKEGDMRALSFPPASLDGVAAFFSIFHLPRDDQSAFITELAKWMKGGAVLVATFSAAEAKEIREPFFGEEMFWSGWGVEGTKEMVERSGLEILRADVLPAEGIHDEADPDHDTEFLWVVARKPGGG